MPATDAHLRLDEGTALAAGARDGHGVAAGGHGEVAGGVAEAHTGRDDLAVHAGRRPCRPRTPRGSRGGWPCRARRRRRWYTSRSTPLSVAHGDHGVLAGAEADDLGGDRRRLAVQDKPEACLSWTKDLVATGLCEGGRKPRAALLDEQGSGPGPCDGVQETDLSLVRLRLRRHSRYYDRGESGCSERRALLGCASLHLVMLTREREIGRSLQKADPQDRALLDLSLRRKVKDDVVAAVLRLQPEEVAPRRAAALDRLAADLGIYDAGRTRQVAADPRRASRRTSGRTRTANLLSPPTAAPAAPAPEPPLRVPRPRPAKPEPPQPKPATPRPPSRSRTAAAAGRSGGADRGRGRRAPRRVHRAACSSAATRTTTTEAAPAAPAAQAPAGSKSVAARAARAGLPRPRAPRGSRAAATDSRLVMSLRDLPPREEAYAVWLYNSLTGRACSWTGWWAARST